MRCTRCIHERVAQLSLDQHGLHNFKACLKHAFDTGNNAVLVHNGESLCLMHYGPQLEYELRYPDGQSS